MDSREIIQLNIFYSNISHYKVKCSAFLLLWGRANIRCKTYEEYCLYQVEDEDDENNNIESMKNKKYVEKPTDLLSIV